VQGAAKTAALDAQRLNTSRRWPLFATLGGVVGLFVITVVVDAVVANRVADRTDDLVDNAFRSIRLVTALRDEAQIVLRSEDPARVRAAVDRIVELSRRYEPLATYQGEQQRWRQLQAALQQLRDGRGTPAVSAAIESEVEALVIINQEELASQTDAIQRVHRNAVVADVAVGGLTLVLLMVLAWLLVRILARQRTLTDEHIRLLAERNRDLDAFAGRAAHDLRVPLNPIRGYADLLQESADLPSEARDMASRIRIAADRMTRIIQDMLELARAGRPSPGVSDPRRVAAEVIDELTMELAGASIDNRFGAEAVACAPGVLGQLLRNLLTNGLKFRSHERPLVIRLASEVAPDQVTLTVEDNGMGMDEETARHAFEPFFRARTDREVPGAGLGLAIVQRTVTSLGGSCRIEVVASGGTRFVVTLPRA